MEHILDEEQESGDLLLTSAAAYMALVAIDFGTTFSGFAFAFNYKDGEKGIHMNREWGTDQGYSTLKTPTCLLLNPDKSFNSFEYEAQDKFAELEDYEAQEYYYFERFKMILHSNEVILIRIHILVFGLTNTSLVRRKKIFTQLILVWLIILLADFMANYWIRGRKCT